MAKPISIPNTFASATSAIPLSQLDQDFSTLANATNDLATYSNYVADTGAADAYIANFPANTNTASLTAGLTIQFKAANANTGASTLNVQVNGSTIGTAAIRYANGSALAAGAIAAGAMVSVMYDGTNFQLINDPAGQSGGDVTGPASATDNAIARFDGTSGKLIQNSVVTIADTTGDISGVGQLNATTLDATNIEVTNIKAKDGTASASIADTTGALTVAAAFAANGGATLGDASGDALTINSSAVSIPNGLNFDSNTLVIDATNNRVGIGTAAPIAPLQVVSSGTSLCQFTGAQYSQVRHSDGTRVFYTQVYDNAAILGTESSTPLLVVTGGSERMRIASGGNVGIGTTSPSYKLQVTNATGVDTEVAVSNSAGLARYGTRGGGNAFAGSFTAGTGFEFWSAGLQRMTIDSSGNVGIGTSSPAVRLDVNGLMRATTWSLNGTGVTGGTTAFSAGTVSTDSNWGYYFRAPTSSSAIAEYSFRNAADTERMRIDSSGNVGIGTSSPAYKLDVTGNVRVLNGSTPFIVDTFGSVQAPGGVYVNTSGTRTAGVNSSGTDLRFRVGNADDRMILDSSGNLGLGVTPSTWSLGRAIQTGSTTSVWNDGSGNAYFGNNFNYNANFLYLTSAPAVSYVQTATGQHRWNISASGTAGNAITFTQAMTLDASGNLQLGTTTAVTSNGTNLNIYGASASNLSLQNATSGTGNANGFQLIQDGLDTYVYNRENGAMLFATNNAERMRITSDGNLIVGATSADSVVRTAVVYTGGTYSSSAMNQSTSARGIDIIGSSNDTALSAALQLTQFNATGRISQTYTATQAGAMTFGLTNGSADIVERMRITSGGRLNIGTTGGSATRLEIEGGETMCVFINTSATDANYKTTMAFTDSGGTTRGTIKVNNSATQYNTSSDYRLKENIAPMVGALSKIQALKPCTYTWKIDGHAGQGFIAHELAEIFPDAVAGEKDAVDADGKPVYQGVDTSFLVATLTAAIQEQQEMIEELKQEVALLKSK